MDHSQNHKTDFQCHTPRDLKWTGGPILPRGSEAQESARKAWAREFIAACKDKSLTAIAVIDHHDICMVRYVLDEAKADGGLIVYPGVEVTCSDNAQCLAIFDPSCPQSILVRFLAGLKNVQPSPEGEPKTCQINCAAMTVENLYDHISDDPLLRENCILLPHFSNDDQAYTSHRSLNEEGHSWRFRTLPADGVYIERPFAELDESTLKKIRGDIKEWGARRRAVIATGDNRYANWDKLGKHDSWIKLGEPSLEAFRQAMLGDEARISHVAPTEPEERVSLYASDPA